LASSHVDAFGQSVHREIPEANDPMPYSPFQEIRLQAGLREPPPQTVPDTQTSGLRPRHISYDSRRDLFVKAARSDEGDQSPAAKTVKVQTFNKPCVIS